MSAIQYCASEEEKRLDFIVKLGGSAVTKKTDFETAKSVAIQHAASVLLKSWKSGHKFVIVHGAGSFGHFQAKEYEVKHGFHNASLEKSAQVKKGFCVTRLSVCQLNQIITRELSNVGLPVVGISPACCWTTENGEVVTHNIDLIKQYIQSGFIPVLHGDAVLDIAHGTTILSGDTIIKALCDHLCPRKVVFLSDVNGIYSKPPTEPGATLLKNIEVQENGETKTLVETNNCGADVTGGIKLKLQTSIDIVRKSQGNIPVYICSIDSGEFQELCVHDQVICENATVISYSV